jgi:hypothetical protein
MSLKAWALKAPFWGQSPIRQAQAPGDRGPTLTGAAHRQHCFRQGLARQRAPCLIKALDADELPAEFERTLIAERVKVGSARAKAQGKHVGPLRIPTHKEAAIRHDLLAGRSLRSTIKVHGVSSKTV